jgi:acid stress-induced BolA-like protein IbaG/YrbA
MELNEKIRTALTKFLGPKSRHRVKVAPVGERVLVYVVSSAFARQSPLKRQQMVAKALRGAESSLTTAELRRIGLVRTLTPAMAAAIINTRKARRAAEAAADKSRRK